jgi:hypothetical protein
LVWRGVAWRGGCGFLPEWYHSTNSEVGDVLTFQTAGSSTQPSGCKHCCFSSCLLIFS